MRKKFTRSICLIAAIAAATLALPADAQSRFGVFGGVWEDGSEPVAGIEFLMPIHGRWFFNPNAAFVAGDRVDRFLLNADVHYDLGRDPDLMLWLGGGLGLIRSEFDHPFGERTETDGALNLLAGIGTTTSGGLIPYAQGKVVLSDNSTFMAVAGIRF